MYDIVGTRCYPDFFILNVSIHVILHSTGRNTVSAIRDPIQRLTYPRCQAYQDTRSTSWTRASYTPSPSLTTIIHTTIILTIIRCLHCPRRHNVFFCQKGHGIGAIVLERGLYEGKLALLFQLYHLSGGLSVHIYRGEEGVSVPRAKQLDWECGNNFAF